METTSMSPALIWAVAFLAGAVHILAPDHWIPLSILSWQRGWDSRRTLALALPLFLAHVLSGLLLYGLLNSVLSDAAPGQVLAVSLAFLLAVSLLRMRRFEGIRGMTRVGRSGNWAWISAAILLGPAESLVPVLLKTGSGENGILLPVIAYLAGTLSAGTGLVLFGLQAWNRPMLLPRSLSFAERQGALVPALLTFGIAIITLLR
jgi:hypothetical protein